MKNLKRALSFALASVMVIGMMVVGAGAADFTDADKIVNDEAVNTLVALNVISGKEDGSYFDPTGSLTRAEAAKLIVYILHGGKAPVIGTKTTPTFTDIKGTWAEAYIEYCASTGVIAGKGDGTFGPTDTLTGSMLAKMLMIAMGYNADVFGFTGAAWEIQTNIEANKIGLYADLEGIEPSAVITRDNAAQMIYNALFAGTMEKSYSYNITDGSLTNGYYFYDDDAKTLYRIKFDGKDVTDKLTAITYNSDKKEYTYTIGNVDVKTSADFSALAGLEVTALYKTENSKDTCYGIYADCDVVTATVGELESVSSSTKKAKLAGETYKLEADFADTDIYVFENNAVVDTGKDLDDTDAAKASTLTLVDSDKNGKFDYAVVAPVTVAKVTYAGVKSITAGANYKFEDHNIADGIEKDDYVVIVAAKNTVKGEAVITKAEFTTGTVSGIKNTDQILVDGTWYKDGASIADVPTLNDEYKFVAIGNYYYSLEKVDEDASMDNLVVAINVDTVSTFTGEQDVKFLTADGSKVVKAVSKVDDTKVTSKAATKNTMYTYKEKDGAWELTTVSTTNDLGYTYDATANYTAETKKVDAKLGGMFINDDAVIFLTAKSGDTAKVITGKALNDWANDITTTNTILYKTVNGMKYVVAAYVNLGTADAPSASGETGNYGYVVSVPYKVEIDDTEYAVYDIWTGDEKVTVQDKDVDLTLAKGNVISYTDLGDGIIEDSTVITAPIAIVGFTDNALVAYKADGTKIERIIDEDTVIMYVDHENKAGVEGGDITTANKNADGSYVMNAWADVDLSTNIVNLLVIEVTNDIDANTAVI